MNARADAERRSWAFTLQLMVVNIAFALVPLVPHANRFFGPLKTPRALSFVAVALSSVLVSVGAYRRWGSGARPYVVAEAVDTMLLYAVTLAFIYASGNPVSPFWILPPFTALFWGSTKPFQRRFYGAILATGHLALAGIYLVRDGNGAAVLLVLVAGLGTYLTFEAVARGGRSNLIIEAERNLIGAQLNATLLERERQRIADVLRDGVGRDLAQLAEAVYGQADPTLRAVLDDLTNITRADADRQEPRTLAELAKRLDDRCRPLCERCTFVVIAQGDGATVIDPSVSRAMLRVGQELVRNAITHGRARSVRLVLALGVEELTLVALDDGTGLAQDALKVATGGLRNADAWLGELRGVLELSPRDAGTELRARVPLLGGVV